MISRKQIAERSRRHNHDENVWVHPFSGRVSGWVTWLFVNLGLSANQVTLMCAIAGFGSALVLLGDAWPLVLASFVLFRLHVLFDVVDGEVARYRGQISRFGSYWDQLMHVVTYPLILMCLVLGRLANDGSIVVAIFGMVGMIGKGLDLGAKSAYYRVLFSSGPSSATTQAPTDKPSTSTPRRVIGLALHLRGFDGMIAFYGIAYFISGTWGGLTTRDWVLVAYAVNFALVGLARALMIPRRDVVPMRRDLR